MSVKDVITRIAPSPTGMFHIGTARTALFNWLYAKANGGRFLLRIDDTDAARNDPAAVQVIFDAMDWLGLDYDATFNQSDNIKNSVYSDCGMALVAHDLAYQDDTGALRLKAVNLPNSWQDDIKGVIKITDNDRKLCDGLVLIRSTDGSPTYHFASVIDDLMKDVTHIIRGVDHVSNTVKQLAIVEALRLAEFPWAGVFNDDRAAAHVGWDNLAGLLDPKPLNFAHLGLIEVIDKDTGKRKKLSKRDDGASLLNYRDAGIDSDAMFNFLLRLGWSPSDANFDRHTPWVTRDQAIDMFCKDGRMKNSPVLLDPAKLDSLNRKIKARSNG